ncbi:hypothetical protein KAR28_06525 [Candidatus Parcubacteria bacterium]|nr:hypothetical protein [Candidatus Parcubacteria bacterium]
MNITAIFVELLIIGLGVLCWLFLFVAYILGLKLDSSFFQINPLFIAPLTAISYILGIVADRLIRDLFIQLVENPARTKVHKEYAEKIDRIKNLSAAINKPLAPMELEKFVRANSQDLGQKIDYNRNRLRICRSWIVHFLLITITFCAWNNKVNVFDSSQQTWIAITGIILFAVTFYTAIKLSVDHQRDIIESSEIILVNKKENIKDS